MWTINGVKERGRNAFRANYWNCVLVALIMGILLGVFTGTAGTDQFCRGIVSAV